MTARPRILITNDDSINATGIFHLWNSLRDSADLYIVAPSIEQSGVGLCVSFRSNLHVAKIHSFSTTESWSVSGTPADCVKLAISSLLNFTPDLIVSGINHGSNAGRNVLYSGTIGGVTEGILRGIPGIAFSSYDMNEPEFVLFEPFIPRIVEYVLHHPLPYGTLLNVNFPSILAQNRKDTYHTKIHGIKLTRQGKQYWLEAPQSVSFDPYTLSYKLGAKLVEFDEHEESDIFWLEQGYITAVPIHVNELTDWRFLSGQKDHFESYVQQVIDPMPR